MMLLVDPIASRFLLDPLVLKTVLIRRTFSSHALDKA